MKGNWKSGKSLKRNAHVGLPKRTNCLKKLFLRRVFSHPTSQTRGRSDYRICHEIFPGNLHRNTIIVFLNDDDGRLEAEDVLARFAIDDFPFDSGPDGRVNLLHVQPERVGVAFANVERASQTASFARVHVVGGPWNRNVKDDGVNPRFSRGDGGSARQETEGD